MTPDTPSPQDRDALQALHSLEEVARGTCDDEVDHGIVSRWVNLIAAALRSRGHEAQSAGREGGVVCESCFAEVVAPVPPLCAECAGAFVTASHEAQEAAVTRRIEAHTAAQRPRRLSPIERMIDEACGHKPREQL